MWHYIENLHTLQETESLHLASKIRSVHIYFSKQKMKVRFVTKFISNSVADALRFYKDELNLEDFENSQATIEFLRKFNNIFDIFISKNLRQCTFRKLIN